MWHYFQQPKQKQMCSVDAEKDVEDTMKISPENNFDNDILQMEEPDGIITSVQGEFWKTSIMKIK